jgi:hypothetical protein
VVLARRAALVIALLSVAFVGRAQTPLSEAVRPRVLRVDASRLTPGQFIYETVLERDQSGTALGARTVSVTRATYANTPAWLLLETRADAVIPSTDSLFADVATLHPIHWGATIGRSRLSMEFRGDTAYGGTSSPAGRKSMVAGMPAGTLVSGAMLESVLRLLPFQSAWEDSAWTLSVSLNAVVSLPSRISVIGEDRVRVPAGQFDCWVVSVRAGESARGLYWVTKSDPIVVRSSVDVPSMGGAQYVSSLSRFSR